MDWTVPFGFGMLVGAVIFDQAWRYVNRLRDRVDELKAEIEALNALERDATPSPCPSPKE